MTFRVNKKKKTTQIFLCLCVQEAGICLGFASFVWCRLLQSVCDFISNKNAEIIKIVLLLT